MSEEGMIPINPSDLPIDTPTLEESGVYNVTLAKATVSPKLSKKDVKYCAMQFEVAEGDYEGMMLMMNYLALPVAIRVNASKKEIIQAKFISAPFGRFCRSFRITTEVPAIASLADGEAIARWQEWIEKYYGNLGKVTVQNQEFPAGSGRLRSSVQDFVF